MAQVVAFIPGVSPAAQFSGTHNGRMSGTTSPRRPGRPSKGERDLIKAKVPVLLKAAAREKAGSQGLDLTEYIERLIARDLGLETPGEQEVLLKPAV